MILPEEVVRYWKLSKDPFNAELRGVNDVMLGRDTSIAELRIWRAIDTMQMSAVVGGVGSGKTTLVERVLAESERDQKYRVVRLMNLRRSKATISHVMDALLIQLVDKEVFKNAELKSVWVRACLLDQEEGSRIVVLVIDEAHELPTQTIKDLKKLYETGGKFKCPLAIILIGQPALQRRLQKDILLQEIQERIDVIDLPGLPRISDRLEYLAFKLKRAGGRSVDELFSADALEKLWKHPASRLPLGINNLVVQALNLGKVAKDKQVSAATVDSVFFTVDAAGLIQDDAGEAPKRKAMAQ